jgi:hypothetical protein
MQNVWLVGHSEYCYLFYVVCFCSGKKIICAAVAHIAGSRSIATVTVTGLMSSPAASGTSLINCKIPACDLGSFFYRDV